MKDRSWPIVGLAAVVALLVAPVVVLAQSTTPGTVTPSGVPMRVADGLANPRGFAWDGQGRLLVAVAGGGGRSSGIVRIEGGCLVEVVAGVASMGVYNSYAGVADLAFLEDRLYALVAAIGAPNGVYRVESNGSLSLVADLGAWLEDHPPASRPRDNTAAGILNAMIAAPDRGTLWVLESNHGRVLTVGPDGTIDEVADLSRGHPVPVGIAATPEGDSYVAYLTVEPYPDGGAKIVRVDAAGTVTDAWTGLTAVADVAVGPQGDLYALEMGTGNSEEAFLRPGTGRALHRLPDGKVEVIASGLDLPVAMGFSPNGILHAATPAFGADDGSGSILRLDGGSSASAAIGNASCNDPA